ncbi:MAG: hypothetical protein QNL33_08005 [Akkermansiaceae bacterium]
MKRLLFLTTLLPCCLTANDWTPLAEKLENLPKAEFHQFGLHDNDGRSMDCLEIFQPKGKTCVYGVYHTLRNGVFSVHLAASKDLRSWSHLLELDKHASQAALHETPNGAFLMAYEKDAPNSCWIRIRHYQNLDALTAGKFLKEIDIPRSLAPTAEGTPSFESVTIPNGDLSKSTIKLRFHFYEDARVDQLASGTLTNFKNWKAGPSPKLNETFKKLGGLGNLGDRDPFQWNGKKYYLQEIQGKVGDWGSWGIYLCDTHGLPLKKLDFKTPKNATAFSNPSVSSIHLPSGEKKLLFSSYIHSRGTQPGEIGQLLCLAKDR